jgi:aminopeptidase N
MKYTVLFALILVNISCNVVNAQVNSLPSFLLSDPPNPTEYREQAFDILHYELDAHFNNIPFRAIRASNKIHFVWDKNPQGKKFYFHLRDLDIDSILYNNQSITYKEIGTKADAEYHYEIEAPLNAKLGDTVILDIRYHGLMTAEAGTSSWGGVQTSSGSFYALGVGFKNNYVSMTQHWMPCFDHPSDKATFTGRFRAKKPFFVASNGNLTIENPTDTAPTYVWKHELPVATYLMTFAVDNFISIPYETEYPSVVYTKQSDSVQTKYAFALLPDMINCFETYFTKYPFEKIGFCITQLGAMEHQTMISYPRSLVFSTFNQKDSMNPVAAHELAHMWFGDLVTPLDFKHAWLTESFATFSEALWFEYKKSKNDYLNYQEKQANDYMNIYSNAEGIFPIYNFVRTGASSNYPRTIYEKGAVVVGMLRYILGDEAFFTSLKEYLNQYQYGNAGTDDIIRIFQSHTTQDLEPFFNEWLFGKGFPIIEIDTTRNNENSFTLSIKQVQQPDWVQYTTLPINIGYFTNNELVGDTVVYLTMNQQSYNIDNIPSNAQLRFNKGSQVRSLFKIKPKVTSTNEKLKQQGMLLVPNPANSMVSVVLPDQQNEWNVVEVYSLLGEKVIHTPIESSNDITFSVASLPKGLYTVVLKNNSQSTVCKLAVE